MESKETGLDALLKPTPEQVKAEEQGSEAEDAATVLLQSVMVSLQERDKKISANAIEIRMLKGRVSQMETFMSYLLQKDPDMLERMKTMTAAVERAEAAVEKTAEAGKAKENVQG